MIELGLRLLPYLTPKITELVTPKIAEILKLKFDELRKEGTVFLSIFRPKFEASGGELNYTISMTYTGEREISPLLPAQEIIVDSKMREDIVNQIKNNIPQTDNEVE